MTIEDLALQVKQGFDTVEKLAIITANRFDGIDQKLGTLSEDASELKHDVNDLKEDVTGLKADVLIIKHILFTLDEKFLTHSEFEARN